MASKFQSRLVGTIILVAIAIVHCQTYLMVRSSIIKRSLVSIPIKPELDSNVEVFEVLDPVEDRLHYRTLVEQVIESGNSETQTAPASK